ncbi:hypothetical protein N7E81_13930 [Reichenbachiella carrageenanivorans]|uniref:Uncharacterized protein n=1 Tax=Reichenbachiella carrageenanivorans TaxID=2979869 RepID=A0ABY6CX13_9BACT|nr:hypothetical protein [Reichenbachiella carrageenanivorans]UXX78456.1 hypothetical protein N7E81_13930 [Reichenbachiella carrageenanivorans]
MFDGSDYPASLEEDVFDTWLENGRLNKISYHYLLIVWDSLDSKYIPVYAEGRHSFQEFEPYGASASHESLVAIYDLYSEARIPLD